MAANPQGFAGRAQPPGFCGSKTKHDTMFSKGIREDSKGKHSFPLLPQGSLLRLLYHISPVLKSANAGIFLSAREKLEAGQKIHENARKGGFP